jgi:hypothetical protein
MRKARNITVSEALKAARYPGGRPQFGIAAAHAARDAAAAQTNVSLTAFSSVTYANPNANGTQAAAHFNSSTNSFPTSKIDPSIPSCPLKRQPSCKNVKPTQTTCFQPLAALQSAILQILYFSTPLITKTLCYSASIILNDEPPN